MITRHVDSPSSNRWSILKRRALLFGATVAVCSAPAMASADEPKSDAKAPATAAAVQGTVGAAKSPEDLIKQIESLSKQPPTGSTRQEFMENFKELRREIIATADQVLAHPDTAGDKGDKQSAQAIGAKITSLQLLTRLGDPKASGELKQLIEKHSADKRPQVSQVISLASLAQRFALPQNGDAAARKAVVEDAKKYFPTIKLTREHGMIMERLTNELQQQGAKDEAVDLLNTFGELLTKSDDPLMLRAGMQFRGTARRLGMMGKPMDVYGKQLDGKPIDWKSYRGKVVLVDFWATWCPPCIREIPNIIKNYELYHDRGFEVIGISVDKGRQEVDAFVEARKIPWTIAMDNDFKDSGKDESLARYYSISGVPTAILVDKEGNVASLNARGPELGRLLETMLGPAEPEKKAEEKKATEKKTDEKKVD